MDPEAFVFEKAADDKAYYSVGILENSEERIGLIVGYSKVFYQKGKIDLPFLPIVKWFGFFYDAS